MSDIYIIGLDQSTQGTKAILVNQKGTVVNKAFLPHRQIISERGWVSHDGNEIYSNVVRVTQQLIESAAIDKGSVAAIGITNQRETTIVWDRLSGEPAAPAIVWQCSRAKELIAELRDPEFYDYVRTRTGIPLSPYFPAAKAAWLPRHSPQAKSLAEKKAALHRHHRQLAGIQTDRRQSVQNRLFQCLPHAASESPQPSVGRTHLPSAGHPAGGAGTDRKL